MCVIILYCQTVELLVIRRSKGYRIIRAKMLFRFSLNIRVKEIEKWLCRGQQ